MNKQPFMIEVAGGGILKFQCPGCQKIFDSRSDFDSHVCSPWILSTWLPITHITESSSQNQSSVQSSQKDNPVRLFYCGLFLGVGIAFLISFIFGIEGWWAVWKTLRQNYKPLLWSLSWALIGIGLGLYITRDNNTDKALTDQYYWTYFIFVLFYASLAGFIGFKGGYALSAFVGLSVGSTVDSLAGLLIKGAMKNLPVK